jgi:hypothetical protein
VAKEYGVDHLPTLVYFENNVPSMFDGDLAVEEKVLEWLIHNVESDEIEDVTDEMLDTLIRKSSHLAVLFCRFCSFLNKQIKQKTTDDTLGIVCSIDGTFVNLFRHQLQQSPAIPPKMWRKRRRFQRCHVRYLRSQQKLKFFVNCCDAR